MLKRTSQTNRLSGRAHRTLAQTHRADHDHASHGGRSVFRAMQLGQTVNLFGAADWLTRF